jgi:hypothetical protein
MNGRLRRADIRWAAGLDYTAERKALFIIVPYEKVI